MDLNNKSKKFIKRQHVSLDVVLDDVQEAINSNRGKHKITYRGTSSVAYDSRVFPNNSGRGDIRYVICGGVVSIVSHSNKSRQYNHV